MQQEKERFIATNWTVDAIPNLEGKTAIVTGGNSGVGYYTTMELARKGAKVIIGCRDLNKGQQATESIKQQVPEAKLSVIRLDLADLDSIQKFAEQILAEQTSLDILVNNAGVMALPKRQGTKQGFEMHFGTNHLGHFALTGRILPLLKKSKTRVVTVSALSSMWGKIDFNDLQKNTTYSPMGAYNQSKLANIMFALELDRRGRKYGITSIAVHPGTANTGIQRHTPQFLRKMFSVVVRLVGNPPHKSAHYPLFASIAPDDLTGMYMGPSGALLKGVPGEVKMSDSANDQRLVQKLWEVSEKLTDVEFDF